MIEFFSLIQYNIFIQYFIIIFFGLFIGSLMNVFIYRLPIMFMYENAVMVQNNSEKVKLEVQNILNKYKNFNLFFPESTCPCCSHKIKWYENIPIFSYLALRGKCSKCKTKISIEYPIVEFSNFLLWLFAFFKFGFTFQLFLILPLLTCLLLVFMIDFKHKIIFDSNHIFIGIIALLLIDNNYIIGDISTKILYSVIFYFVFLGFISFYEKIRNIDTIFGRGDIKLLSIILLYMNFYDFINLISLSILLGFVYFIFLKMINKFDYSKEIPFAPMIVTSFILFLFEIKLNLFSIY